ncbi:indole-3-glycerol phosphate synthase TrpC [soil metagenome]
MTDTFLDKILAIKRGRVESVKRKTDLSALKQQALSDRSSTGRHRLSAVLRRKNRPNIIAEIKRASPSGGVINDKVDVAVLARQYEIGGAAAISVLTEEDFFRGSLADLTAVREAVDLPILRKDFIVDEFQIYESAAAGADVILLIVAALSEGELSDFYDLVTAELGMDVIVEIHTADELEVAARIGADIIGVNNRDLRTLKVSIDVSRNLIRNRHENALMVAESGISSRKEIEELRSLGFDGFLIGETLMRSSNPAELMGGLT